VALYTNGVLLETACLSPIFLTNAPFTNGPVYTNGPGVCYPPAGYLNDQFFFGNFSSGACSILGQLDEVETFNYPMTAEQVAAGFPTFAGTTSNITQDTSYVGVSDVLQSNVYPTVPQCRLGYWRFDSPTLMAEQGQIPLSQSGVTPVPSWSGTAASVGSAHGSQLTYSDVNPANGWANINCKQGNLRFWFKPNGSLSSVTAPFIYLGSTNGTEQWTLEVSNSMICFVAVSNVTFGGTVLSSSMPSGWSSGSPTNWTQIVLTYGVGGTGLYTNGVLAATNSATLGYWPSLGSRETYGMVIGNTTAYYTPINGQFEEMETFNYELTPTQIANNFQLVASVDSNLNGIPDLLEDIQLSTNRPFLGAPVAVTGTVEAEQFDMGGANIGYYSSATHPTNAYRPTGMYVNTCSDLGGGYCLDQMAATDWAEYTINVLAPQTYTVEVRAQAIGTTGGIFDCEFSNSVSGLYANTGPLTNTSTSWTNYSAVVTLKAGINVMKLHCLTNASGTNVVGRFNYISIYPWWQPGFTSTFTTVVTGLSNNINTWAAATNNAIQIQNIVNSASGGTVSIPAGTYYVAQSSPNDAASWYLNTAVQVSSQNVTITGAGIGSTILVGYDRSTTVFSVGLPNISYAPNFTLENITIQAQPHLIATNAGGGTYSTIYEPWQLVRPTSSWIGYQTVFSGYNSSYNSYNILLTNCQFLYGDYSVGIVQNVSNCLVCNSSFTAWAGTNVYTGMTNNTLYTTNYGGSVGIFAFGACNVLVSNNVYIGNSNLVSIINTNSIQLVAPDGFVLLQAVSNCFIGRNMITNNALEAVQVDAGPNSVVGNTFYTLVSAEGCCALNAINSAWVGFTGTNSVLCSTGFIGNSVYGGRMGERGWGSVGYFSLNFSGNQITLYPPFDEVGDLPGAAVAVDFCQFVNVCGNTLVSGGHGFLFFPGGSNALILANDFSASTYSGIG
jgi:hypothetical protein